ncbi:hypothetical protein ED208_11735 [Stagnimonas aquatica]|uniref:Uncharacterized protein n=1 Tax=Stagnimonas aquatica TaxID=2689987 RepID=A0A3N0V8F1_9GAMM|nr:hypothetical protein [Stagnimonas aquatica]ROH89077.1 hypothetical protein ED208_11735 [Stagnimonas aquatica]
MDAITLAQSALPSKTLKAVAFWTELDAAMQELPAQCLIHGTNARDYRLGTIQLSLSLAQNSLLATWSAESAVLEARGRLELAQLAQAWLGSLAALELPTPPVAARVQAASSLLSAGYVSVSVQNTGQLINTPQGLKAGGQAFSMAA